MESVGLAGVVAHIKIGIRIYIGFGLILLLLGAVGVLGVRGLKSSQEAYAGYARVAAEASQALTIGGEAGHGASQVLDAARDLSEQTESLNNQVDGFIQNIRAG